MLIIKLIFQAVNNISRLLNYLNNILHQIYLEHHNIKKIAISSPISLRYF